MKNFEEKKKKTVFGVSLTHQHAEKVAHFEKFSVFCFFFVMMYHSCIFYRFSACFLFSHEHAYVFDNEVNQIFVG